MQQGNRCLSHCACCASQIASCLGNEAFGHLKALSCSIFHDATQPCKFILAACLARVVGALPSLHLDRTWGSQMTSYTSVRGCGLLVFVGMTAEALRNQALRQHVALPKCTTEKEHHSTLIVDLLSVQEQSNMLPGHQYRYRSWMCGKACD